MSVSLRSTSRRLLRGVLMAAAVAACNDSPMSPRLTRAPDRVAAAVTFASLTKHISTNYEHTCAIDSVGRAWCWGSNKHFSLGFDTAGSHTPARITSRRVFASISAGQYHNCALTPTGAGYCWGNNYSFELGGSTFDSVSIAPVRIPGNHTFVQLSAGQRHTCGVTADNALFCWGNDDDGQIGDPGNYPNPHTITRVHVNHPMASVSAGEATTCGLTTDSLAFCWGKNDLGELGTGDTVRHIAPTRVAGGHHFARISTRGTNTCALTADGVAYCWGDNSYGQLGIGGSGAPALSPVEVQTAAQFTDIDVGAQSVCALTALSVVYCWGNHNWLADGHSTTDSLPHKVDGTHVFTQLGAGMDDTCAEEVNRHFFCWGADAYGQLGTGIGYTDSYTPQKVIKVVAAN